MANRQVETRCAAKLQQALGSGYEVRYDACESGMTFFYFHGILYKKAANSEMVPNLSVTAFAAPAEVKFRVMVERKG